MLLLLLNAPSAMDWARLNVKPVKLRGDCHADDATRMARSNVQNAADQVFTKPAPIVLEAVILSANMATSWESVAPAKVLDNSTAVHVLEAEYSNAGTAAVTVL